MGLLEDGRSGMDPGQQVGSQSRAWFLVTIRREKTAERAPSYGAESEEPPTGWVLAREGSLGYQESPLAVGQLASSEVRFPRESMNLGA